MDEDTPSEHAPEEEVKYPQQYEMVDHPV